MWRDAIRSEEQLWAAVEEGSSRYGKSGSLNHSTAGVGIDVPTFGDLCHITTTNIFVGDEISPF